MKNKQIKYLTKEELEEFSKYILLRNKLLKKKNQKIYSYIYSNFSKSELAFLLTLKVLNEVKPSEVIELKKFWLKVRS